MDTSERYPHKRRTAPVGAAVSPYKPLRPVAGGEVGGTFLLCFAGFSITESQGFVNGWRRIFSPYSKPPWAGIGTGRFLQDRFLKREPDGRPLISGVFHEAFQHLRRLGTGGCFPGGKLAIVAVQDALLHGPGHGIIIIGINAHISEVNFAKWMLLNF